MNFQCFVDKKNVGVIVFLKQLVCIHFTVVTRYIEDAIKLLSFILAICWRSEADMLTFQLQCKSPAFFPFPCRPS
jgi:hypothetical protein